MNKLLKIFLIVLGTIVVIIGLAALYLSLPQASVKGKQADLTLSAFELYEEYQADEAAGNKKYIDKIIEVKGTIAEISTDENGATVVMLRDKDAFSGILCTLREDEKKRAKDLKVGQEVTIKGQCTGMLMDVVLNKCVLVQ